MQNEHGLAACSLDVDMRGAMIVWIDDNAQAIKSENSRHVFQYIETEAFGKEPPPVSGHTAENGGGTQTHRPAFRLSPFVQSIAHGGQP